MIDLVDDARVFLICFCFVFAGICMMSMIFVVFSRLCRYFFNRNLLRMIQVIDRRLPATTDHLKYASTGDISILRAAQRKGRVWLRGGLIEGRFCQFVKSCLKLSDAV